MADLLDLILFLQVQVKFKFKFNSSVENKLKSWFSLFQGLLIMVPKGPQLVFWMERTVILKTICCGPWMLSGSMVRNVSFLF